MRSEAGPWPASAWELAAGCGNGKRPPAAGSGQGLAAGSGQGLAGDPGQGLAAGSGHGLAAGSGQGLGGQFLGRFLIMSTPKNFRRIDGYSSGAGRSPRPFPISGPKCARIHVGGRADLPNLPTLWGDRANVVISQHLPGFQYIEKERGFFLYLETLGDGGRSRRWHDLPKGLGGLGDLPAPRRGSLQFWG